MAKVGQDLDITTGKATAKPFNGKYIPGDITKGIRARYIKTDGTIIIERDYYEMYFSYEEGKDLFNTIPCRGYQFVYMPPGYEMVIHKDISYVKSRIGSLLQGSGDILFYNDKNNVIDSYNYDEDILTDTQVKHNVINNNEWRLTFFANFEEPIDVINAKLQY